MYISSLLFTFFFSRFILQQSFFHLYCLLLGLCQHLSYHRRRYTGLCRVLLTASFTNCSFDSIHGTQLVRFLSQHGRQLYHRQSPIIVMTDYKYANGCRHSIDKTIRIWLQRLTLCTKLILQVNNNKRIIVIVISISISISSSSSSSSWVAIIHTSGFT